VNHRLPLFALGLVCVSVVGMFTLPAAHSDEPTQRVARVGFVQPQSPSTATRGIDAFWAHLHELGWAEGQNLFVERRSAEGRYERLPALMTEVLGHKVDVLVTSGTAAAIAAKNATDKVPIVVGVMGDPLRTGLVASLARPGGNLTGLSLGYAEGMAGKWLQLLQETVPRLSNVAVITNPDNPLVRSLAKEVETIAPARGLKILRIEVRNPETLNHAFEQAGQKAQAVLVLPDPIIAEHRTQVSALATKYRLPTMYALRDFVDVGGLMVYGPDFAVAWRRAADYVDKILKGAKPADLPIEQPTKYVLVVNLKTAKALGITIPESILLRADEVIR